MDDHDDAVTPVSVRFDAAARAAMQSAAEADGCTVSEWLRRAAGREVERREGAAAITAGWVAERPEMALSIGEGDQWRMWLSDRATSANDRWCCDGHGSPEDAAAHGALLAAQAMSAWARRLPAGTCGGDLLARAS